MTDENSVFLGFTAEEILRIADLTQTTKHRSALSELPQDDISSLIAIPSAVAGSPNLKTQLFWVYMKYFPREGKYCSKSGIYKSKLDWFKLSFY